MEIYKCLKLHNTLIECAAPGFPNKMNVDKATQRKHNLIVLYF